jgi:hypothetical protein
MTKITEKASSTRAKSSRPKLFYISFGEREQDLLEFASPEELALYFYLKTRSNFKTGAFPKYKKDEQSYDSLAAVMRRHDGKARGIVEIQEILDRLAARGLVRSVALSGHRLTMELPLSPLRPLPAPEPAADPIVISQPENAPSEVPGFPSIVMNNKNSSFYNTDSIVGAAVAAHCGAGAAVAMMLRNPLTPSENPVPENPEENPEDQTPVLHDWNPLEVEDIMALVDDSGRFAYATTAESQTFYRGWIEDGFEFEDILNAMNAVLANVETQRTPAAIDRELRKPDIPDYLKPKHRFSTVQL